MASKLDSMPWHDPAPVETNTAAKRMESLFCIVTQIKPESLRGFGFRLSSPWIELDNRIHESILKSVNEWFSEYA